MNMSDPFFRTSAISGVEQVSIDAGLRAHMQSVFNYMAGGLALTGALAFAVANIPALMGLIFGTPLKWIVMLAPLGFMMYLNFKLDTMPLSRLRGIFWAFCSAMGLSMATIFVVFAGEDIARAFFITAALFGAMSLWGYTTRKDLTSLGAFMTMGLFGILIASVINLFLVSSALQWVVSVVCVLVFTGLTAYQVQVTKQSYSPAYGDEANGKMALISALQLYLNFINLFQAMLSLMGGRRE
jgi:FtsH-binding integral membrane protein